MKARCVRIFALALFMQVVLHAGRLLASPPGGDPGGRPGETDQEHAIRIDIPVVLTKADVVFNMDHMAFSGDMSIGINYMRLLSNRFKEMNTQGHIIGVFHGEAAYLTLNDNAYNIYRKVTTGNPHKELIAELQKLGVQIEECGVSMKNHGWGNDDLLGGVKVNSGAIVRLIQLSQQGYVQIEP
ncbi:MAG TPA: DsrE family protein [Bacteroidota bacterium]|nr:DsrE family protein [Bacteroidota bacterium]